MMRRYIKKMSRSYGRYRFLRLFLYVLIFFIIIGTLTFNVLFSTMMNPAGLSADPCRFDFLGGVNLTKFPVKYSLLGNETHINDILGFSVNMKFNDGFELIFPAQTVTGITKNIIKYRDFQILSGHIRDNGIYISESMWKKIKSEYAFAEIGQKIKLSFKNAGVNITKGYTIAGVIKKRWIFYYFYRTTEEILVPISFFSEIPKTYNLHDFNETVYYESTAIRVPEKYVSLIADTYEGISYYYETHEHTNDYNSFLFISGNILVLTTIIGGAISLYATVVNTRKYSSEIGILRAVGVPNYKTTAFFLFENFYAMIIAFVITIFIEFPFSLGFLIGVFSISVVSAVTAIILVPIGISAVMLIPSLAYMLYHLKSREIVETLRNK